MWEATPMEFRPIDVEKDRATIIAFRKDSYVDTVDD